MFGQKIKKLRESNELSMDKLVSIYNNKFNGKMNKSTLSRYENGLQEPMYTVVKNLAELFNVSIDYLSSDDETEIDYNRIGIIPLPKTKKLPLLGTIACGEPILAEENIEEYIETPEDIRATFCLRCKGDSMINARIFDGDIVYIREQPDVENGEIAAVLIDDEATLKRVYKSPDKVILQPENPIYEPLVFIKEEINTLKILGKAVAFTSTVR